MADGWMWKLMDYWEHRLRVLTARVLCLWYSIDVYKNKIVATTCKLTWLLLLYNIFMGSRSPPCFLLKYTYFTVANWVHITWSAKLKKTLCLGTIRKTWGLEHIFSMNFEEGSVGDRRFVDLARPPLIFYVNKLFWQSSVAYRYIWSNTVKHLKIKENMFFDLTQVE